MRYPPAGIGMHCPAQLADRRFNALHPTTLAACCPDRDTDGGPSRSQRRARYCFHDSL